MGGYLARQDFVMVNVGQFAFEAINMLSAPLFACIIFLAMYASLSISTIDLIKYTELFFSLIHSL